MGERMGREWGFYGQHLTLSTGLVGDGGEREGEKEKGSKGGEPSYLFIDF